MDAAGECLLYYEIGVSAHLTIVLKPLVVIIRLTEDFDCRRFSMKKCNDVMTKDPICCLPGDSVAKAAELMKNENIGSIPVIENEQNQKLVGIVTDRDLALKIVALALDAKTTTVGTVMTHEVVTCHAEDDLQAALDAMAEHQLRRIPVVDNANKIVGIIAQADVATRVDQPEKTAEMVKEISQANGK